MNAFVIPFSQFEDENIIYHNKQRKKNTREIIKEAEVILGLIGKSQGQRRDLLKEEKDKFFGTIGKDRFERAAIMMGCKSGSTLRRIMDVVEFEKENEDHKNLGLVEKIISEELSPTRAYNLANEFLKDKKAKEISLNTESISTTHNDYIIYNKTSLFMEEVETETVQVVITSPPYFQLRLYGNSSQDTSELGLELSVEEYISKVKEHLKSVKRVLKNDGSFFLNINDKISKGANLLIPNKLILELCENQGWFLVNEIIWHKSNFLPKSHGRRLENTYERIFHLVKDPANYYYEEYKNWDYEKNEAKLLNKAGGRNLDGSQSTDGFTLAKGYTKFKDFLDEHTVENIFKGPNAAGRQKALKKINNEEDHPAVMPDYLPVIPILTTSKIGDIVLDPFSGSGTVGKAANLFGRKYIGYEINERYAELSKSQ